jgi:DNA-binding response OmpR family regulator
MLLDMKVLIAEDNLFSRRLLKTILEKAGYEIVEATDGEGAWELLQQEDAPRLLVLDWMMPGIDGLDLCQRLRQKYEHSAAQPYVIMVTSKANVEDIVRGLRSGADDYITKPFDNEELKARIAIGKRIIDLQNDVQRKIDQLEAAVQKINALEQA